MQAILFDLDGVLYQGNALLPGAAESVAWARDEGIPHLFLTNAAIAALSTAPARTLMIGDDIRGDVAGAQQAGLRAALVRTGKFRPSDLHGEIRPDAVLSGIGELPAWWSRHAG